MAEGEDAPVLVEPLSSQCKGDWSPVKTSHPTTEFWIGYTTTLEGQRTLVNALKKTAYIIVKINREQVASNEIVGCVERSLWMAKMTEFKKISLLARGDRKDATHPLHHRPPARRPRLARASVASRSVRVTSAPCACSRCTDVNGSRTALVVDEATGHKAMAKVAFGQAAQRSFSQLDQTVLYWNVQLLSVQVLERSSRLTCSRMRKRPVVGSRSHAQEGEEAMHASRMKAFRLLQFRRRRRVRRRPRQPQSGRHG